MQYVQCENPTCPQNGMEIPADNVPADSEVTCGGCFTPLPVKTKTENTEED